MLDSYVCKEFRICESNIILSLRVDVEKIINIYDYKVEMFIDFSVQSVKISGKIINKIRVSFNASRNSMGPPRSTRP